MRGACRSPRERSSLPHTSSCVLQPPQNSASQSVKAIVPLPAATHTRKRRNPCSIATYPPARVSNQTCPIMLASPSDHPGPACQPTPLESSSPAVSPPQVFCPTGSQTDGHIEFPFYHHGRTRHSGELHSSISHLRQCRRFSEHSMKESNLRRAQLGHLPCRTTLKRSRPVTTRPDGRRIRHIQ